MQRLTFTAANGQQIKMDTRPFRLLTLQGAGAVQTDIQTQKAPYQDGATYIDALLEPRFLLLDVAIMAENNERLYQHRRKLAQVFNPKLGPGLLRYEYDGGVKEIEAVAELAPEFPTGRDNRAPGFQRAILSLVCPSPFWMDNYTVSEEIVTWIGGMRFPWRLPSRFAMKGPKIINIINRGDVETPVRIEFRGPATNPRVTNRATGEYIQINRELLSGDVLVITTDFGNKRVEINGQNVFNWIDQDSTFWQLDIGDNVIEYTSDDPVESAAVTISYRNRYVGV